MLRCAFGSARNDNGEKRDDIYSKVLDEQTFLTGKIGAQYSEA